MTWKENYYKVSAFNLEEAVLDLLAIEKAQEILEARSRVSMISIGIAIQEEKDKLIADDPKYQRARDFIAKMRNK